MPDLATHVAAAYLASWFKLNLRRETLSLFLLGNILPDILTRPIYAVLPQAYWFFAPLHTPVGIVLACGVISQMFDFSLRKKTFMILLVGAVFHLLLDSLQKRVVDVYGILFPISWKDIYIGVFWPDESLVLLFVLLIIIFLCMISKQIFHIIKDSFDL